MIVVATACAGVALALLRSVPGADPGSTRWTGIEAPRTESVVESLPAGPASRSSSSSRVLESVRPELDEPTMEDASAEPRREAEFLARLRTHAREDRVACLEHAGRIADGDGPECARFAALRVAFEEGWLELHELLARTALAHGTALESTGNEPAADAFVTWLAGRALTDARAREELEVVAWNPRAGVSTTVRTRALRACIAAASESELAALSARVASEPDPDVHAAGRAALEERDSAATLGPKEETP